MRREEEPASRRGVSAPRPWPMGRWRERDENRQEASRGKKLAAAPVGRGGEARAPRVFVHEGVFLSPSNRLATSSPDINSPSHHPHESRDRILIESVRNRPRLSSQGFLLPAKDVCFTVPPVDDPQQNSVDPEVSIGRRTRISIWYASLPRPRAASVIHGHRGKLLCRNDSGM